MIVDGMRSSAPHEIATVDLFTGGTQLTALLQVQHLTTDDDGASSITCGLDCAQDGVQAARYAARSEEHTSELQSRFDLVCRLLLEKKKKNKKLKVDTTIYR